MQHSHSPHFLNIKTTGIFDHKDLAQNWQLFVHDYLKKKKPHVWPRVVAEHYCTLVAISCWCHSGGHLTWSATHNLIFLYFLHRYVDTFSFYSSHLTHFSWRRASFLDASFISVNHPLSMSRLAFSLCCLLVSMKKCESQKNVKVKYFWNLSHPILSLWVSADSVKAMFSFFIFLYFQSV